MTLHEQYKQGLITKTEYVLNSPASSYWLKEAIQALGKRDPVDALRDAELLVTICKEHLQAIPKIAGYTVTGV